MTRYQGPERRTQKREVREIKEIKIGSWEIQTIVEMKPNLTEMQARLKLLEVRPIM